MNDFFSRWLYCDHLFSDNTDDCKREEMDDVNDAMMMGSRFQHRMNDSETLDGGGGESKWTAALACRSGALFVAAAAFEILGGWLVWQFVREKKSVWYLFLGFVVLMLYGVIPCYQPLDDFGRTYAAYGGIFIVGSYAFARIVDGFRLDVGDFVGGAISLVGVAVAVAWPRDGGGLKS